MNFIPESDREAPMTAAPFVWRADGRPDWGAMWTTFCELALLGGPPHRGVEQALRGPLAGLGAASAPDIVAEIRRGIWETTGMYAEPPVPGWIAVTCESGAMARWLAAAIARENVEARVAGDRVLLPAGPSYRVEDEVKSIVTVVAKTHHYWVAHVEDSAADGGEARLRHAFRCVGCGLDFYVARGTRDADHDATCPVDGATMARLGAAPVPVSAAGPPFWHSHGPGEAPHFHGPGPGGARP